MKIHAEKPMRLNDKYLYVGCIPVHACPEHPEDQSPCVQEDCRHCKEPMWVSEKKRKLRNKKPKKVQIYCLECLAIATLSAGYEPVLMPL